jgi:NAD+ kinase
MKNIGLVVKKTEEARTAARNLSAWLTARGLSVFMDEPELTRNHAGCPDDERGRIPADVDLVVVFGGDGTLLYAARTTRHTGAPLLGVNLGGLGFLAEIGPKDLYPTLEKILAGDFRIENRMMLSVSVERRGQTVGTYTVLNDAVINKGALARILNLRVRIDGREATAYRGDGLIISTPTGSTAYNLAAGGPIVHPAQETILLTPICPFTLNNRPLILPVSMEIQIEVDPEATRTILTADGQTYCDLEPGDIIRIVRADTRVAIIKSPYKDYFEILRTKLGWG